MCDGESEQEAYFKKLLQLLNEDNKNEIKKTIDELINIKSG